MNKRLSNITLVLFTSLFPYEGGETFLETEIEYLAKEFKRVIIVPTKKRGNIRKTPTNVEVDTSIANSKTRYLYKLKSLANYYFVSNFTFNKNEIKYLFKNSIYVKNFTNWINRFLQKENANKVLFYSYWFEAPTAALTIVKNKNSDVKFISRVHGGDLYEYLYGLVKFPFREKILSTINRVFTISEFGKEHLIKNYSLKNNKVIVSRLGVLPAEYLSQTSKDEKIRIVSCSNLIKIKRIDLLIESLAKLKNKNIKIIWTHIGNGELKHYLEQLAKEQLGNNIEFNFTGYFTNREVLNFYKSKPVDVFINTSSSEGIPVSIMEAQSFGIPVIAPNIGGIKEIVNNENGYLLKSNPSPKEISEVILGVKNNNAEWNKKRIASFESWQKKFNADNNYKKFINNLVEIL